MAKNSANKAVTITNTLIKQLSNNKEAVEKFPFLRIKKPPGNGCCGAPEHPIDFNSPKLKIASLTGERLNEFKSLLNANSIRVIYLNGKQSTTKEI